MQGLAGTVVEPGFGSGTNLPYYPAEVSKVYAVDPAVLGQKLAAVRLAQSQVEVEFIGLDGQAIPLPDDSCDAGLLTFTLCTIPDAAAALSELRRIIKPGGFLHFAEHGLAEDPQSNAGSFGSILSRSDSLMAVTSVGTILIFFSRLDSKWTGMKVTTAKGPPPGRSSMSAGPSTLDSWPNVRARSSDEILLSHGGLRSDRSQ